jgi:hypothetical protein
MRLLAALVCTAAAGTAVLSQNRPQKPDHAHDHTQHAAHFEACAKACDDCARACEQCSTHCAMMAADGKKDHLVTLKCTRDCATICSAASAVVSRGGSFNDLICAACAEACKRCGEACGQHQDPVMQRCAAECKKCEAACREMLAHAGK